MIAQLLNAFLILIIIACFFGVLYYRLSKNKSIVKEVISEDSDKYSLDSMILYVKDSLNELIRTNLYDLGLSKEEFET